MTTTTRVRWSNHSEWLDARKAEFDGPFTDIDAIEVGTIVEQRTNDYKGPIGTTSIAMLQRFAARIGWGYRQEPSCPTNAAFRLYLRAFRTREPAFVYAVVGNAWPTADLSIEPLIQSVEFRRFRRACLDASVPLLVVLCDADGAPIDDQLALDIMSLTMPTIRRIELTHRSRLDAIIGTDIYDRLRAARDEVGRYRGQFTEGQLSRVWWWVYPEGGTKRTGGWQKEYFPLRSLRAAGVLETRATLFPSSESFDDRPMVELNKAHYGSTKVVTVPLYTTEAEKLLSFNEEDPRNDKGMRDFVKALRAAVEWVG